MAINPLATPLQTPNLPQGIIQAMQAWRNQQQTGLQNQTLQAGLPYVGPQAAANVALAQGQGALANAQAQYMPLNAQGQYFRGIGDYMRSMVMNSPAYAVSKFIQTPEYQSLVKTNPQVAQSLTSLMKNSTIYGAAGQQGFGLPVTNPNSGQLSAPNNTPVTPSAPSSSSDVQGVQDAAGSALIDKTVPSQIQNQRYYSQTLNGMLEKAAPLMKSASQYAGIGGDLKLANDKVKASLGYKVPDYENYKTFIQTEGPLISNELRRTLGGQATDSERTVMDSLIDTKNWASNPSLAIRQFDTLRNIYQQNVDPTLAKTQNQVANDTASSQKSSPSTKSTYGMDEINDVAKRYNMSVTQVKQLMKEKGIG